ncbi:hypothetical protein [Paenibacillus sp. HJGM_3]|uniref:hypothetical protein n=1 Tax=Paenibacillus sp. HJGM_3 TaxID=3379816 RepID=UPI00385BB1F5
MPDWSYHGLFRPLLFRLPAELARDVTLGAMGALCKLPGGSWVIRTMGHMELYPALETTRWGIRFQYPVGLGGGLDVHGAGRTALAQIGFGFIEVGPVTVQKTPPTPKERVVRDLAQEAIVYPDAYANDGLEAHLKRLEQTRKQRSVAQKPIFIRTRHCRDASPEKALEEQLELITRLNDYAAGFYIDALDGRWSVEASATFLTEVATSARAIIGPEKPLFLYIPLDYPIELFSELLRLLTPTQESVPPLFEGIVIGDWMRTERGFEVGAGGKGPIHEKIVWLKGEYGNTYGIIASGGVHEPLDAMELMQAGADLVQLHSGLVYAGPGLPKRINEAILHERLSVLEEPPAHAFWRNWGWMSLLGVGMILGGIMAWIIAATSVLLPYDELFLGMERDAMSRHNGHLLPFMSHDRITLAGTMISIGVLYVQLSTYGLQYNLHWARTALIASAVVGFFSFFLYLGYGYFDPLHAAAAVVLLPMFLLSLRGVKDNRPYQQPRPNVRNDRLWRRAQIGQLLFVLLGGALAVGGLVIAGIGITHVFVPTDLAFLGMHAEQLDQINPRLAALIAHDRAGFGGALFSDAIALLGTALWGIQQGQRWLWRTLLIGGLPGFAAGLSVHMAIGYTDFIHLLPAYAAVALYVAGLILLYPYMHAPVSEPSRSTEMQAVG